MASDNIAKSYQTENSTPFVTDHVLSVTLTLDATRRSENNPLDWDWRELLDLGDQEDAVVRYVDKTI